MIKDIVWGLVAVGAFLSFAVAVMLSGGEVVEDEEIDEWVPPYIPNIYPPWDEHAKEAERRVEEDYERGVSPFVETMKYLEQPDYDSIAAQAALKAFMLPPANPTKQEEDQ